jgi:hypothetical protein
MGGRACIRGMRMTVSNILGQLADGATIEELLSEYPYLGARTSANRSLMPRLSCATKCCSPSAQCVRGRLPGLLTFTPRNYMRLRSAAPGGASLPEGWPSGQWQQTVNLPVNTYVGSNPTPSTNAAGGRSALRRAEEAGVAQW